jgi:hypothetical protein
MSDENKKKGDGLGEIDLEQFAKTKEPKPEPICKGCKYTWCGSCREERELGRNLKGVFDVFVGQLRDSLDLEYLLDNLFGEDKINRILDGFAMRMMKEVEIEERGKEL